MCGASGGRGRTALEQDEAVAVMLEKYEVCCSLFGPVTTAEGVSAGLWLRFTSLCSKSSLFSSRARWLRWANGQASTVTKWMPAMARRGYSAAAWS